MKVLGGMSRLRHHLTSLFAGRNEEEACFETARSARGFSKRATAVLDDKLAFSATLMRAGEVDAAFRMMREAQADVWREETALFEIVDKVAAAGTTKRRRRARLHLARTLATALVSFALLTLSVGGFALASAVVQRMSPDQAANAGGGASAIETEDAAFVREVRSVRLANGVRLNVAAKHVGTYRKISRGQQVAPGRAEALLRTLPPSSLRAFLWSLPPQDVQTLIASLPPDVVDELTIWFPPVATDAVAHVEDETKSDKPAAGEAERQEESPSESEESEEAAPEAQPSPEPTDGDTEDSESTKESKKKRDGGSSTDETELNLDLDGLLPKSD